MAELLLGAVLPVLVEKLLSQDLLDFASRYKGLGKKLGNWKETLSGIQALLDDAEEKQHTNRAVKRWLDDLRDLAYDIEDILDEFDTEALLCKLRGENQGSTSKVRNLIPACCTGLTPHALKINIRLESKITDITDRFNVLLMQETNLRLKETADGKSHRKTGTVLAPTSLVTEPHIYGRDEDKEVVLELLLSEKCRDAQLSVIPIRGMGGIGKTTLAKFVFHDKKVQSFFDLKAWACVSEDFDAIRVTKTILASVTSENFGDNDLNLLQVKLKETLKGKKFLVVLDDLWNENYDSWTILLAPFLEGAPGSAIVITTRNQGVSSTTRSLQEYHLKVLSNEASLSLFTQHALGANNFSAHPNLKDIGEKIVEKCKGLPLAAKTLGGLLRTKLDRYEWEGVLKSKIWDIPEERSAIVPALMLSYYHLPSHLKRCFAYCSILPKDYEFKEKQLVLLWVAEGLIQPQGDHKQMEDLGSQHFRDLLSRSFFQQSSMKKSKFIMHDLINDLAQWVAGDICYRMEDRIEGINKREFPIKVRHLSYLGDRYDGPKKFEVFSKLKCLRTFMPLMLPNRGSCYLTHDVSLKLLSKLPCLRVLSLSGYCIVELPDSIGDLKHLRYLDLSYTRIRGLPESTTTLCNLQTLILKSCSYLEELPSNLGNLVNLRHLNILNADKLERMPPQIGKLTSLQTLSNLIMGKGNCFPLKELGSLLHLRGTLIISRLENAIEPRDACDAKLIEKPGLTALCLEWSFDVDDSQDRKSELDVLNMLQPNDALEELTIKHYGSTKFPTWLKGHSFPHMVLLRIENCKKCTSLPPASQLPSLKHLFIEGMASVKNVGDEFYGSSCSQPFESLETLYFENMEEWESWSPNGEFPHLHELSIKNCPKLLGNLPNHLPSLQNVVIERCKQLVVSISSFPELCKLEFENSKGVVRKSKVEFSSLNSKSLSRISDFTCPREGFMNVESLRIANCEELTPFWSNDVGLLKPLPRLSCMKVIDCQKLVSLVAEDVKEQPQQGMASTRNDTNSLPKALMYNNKCLERIRIEECDSLTHIATCQLPPTLKRLEIWNCKNIRILLDEDDINSCSSSTSLLEDLTIFNCPSLKSLTSSGELPATLKDIDISDCQMLESVAKSFHQNSSLEKIDIESCENLKSLTDEGLLPCNLRELSIFDCGKMRALPNCIHSITSLRELTIEKCPGVESFPGEGFPTNLTSLEIIDCDITEALLEWGLQKLTSLQYLRFGGGCPHLLSFPEMTLSASLTSLYIRNLPNLEYLSSEGFRYLSSLKTLEIGWCEKLMSFPDDGLPASLTSLHIRNLSNLKYLSSKGFRYLSSLKTLRIDWCEKLMSFPDDGLPPSLTSLHIRNLPNLKYLCSKGFRYLSSLQKLRIGWCEKLISFPDDGLPPSLLDLRIVCCEMFTSFPKDGLPPLLQQLHIANCPLLKRHCKKDQGREWSKIAHIPRVEIDVRLIYDPEPEEQNEPMHQNLLENIFSWP
ncbi:putative disease resistance RPP13-like protein 1 [Alnus glutinosa]|uniref:putative disease resistance RPP13-like protein 1 n=1 Tax=Alnus glutinosa TaxID=3517 RepID=UPI002D7988E8|nr:putative disease resistance RPP13-like protein 1 [Alnus glutinosa]